MPKELIDLYTIEQYLKTTDGITAMALRFNIQGNDVIHALWSIAKDNVWAKLAFDLKERKEKMKKNDEQ